MLFQQYSVRIKLIDKNIETIRHNDPRPIKTLDTGACHALTGLIDLGQILTTQPGARCRRAFQPFALAADTRDFSHVTIIVNFELNYLFVIR